MFFSMLTNTFKRQQLWSLLPMDPSAWYFLLTQHQSELTASQSATLAAASLIMGPSRPAQGQGVSSSRAETPHLQLLLQKGWTHVGIVSLSMPSVILRPAFALCASIEYQSTMVRVQLLVE